MERPYAKLHKRLREQDFTRAYLAECIGVSISYVSQCMNGHSAWTLDIQWKIMELLNIDPKKMYKYFPPPWEEKKKHDAAKLVRQGQGVA